MVRWLPLALLAALASPLPPVVSTALASPQALLAAAALDPRGPQEKAPDVFYARFTTTKGAFVVQVRREWAPHGADRFYNLVKGGFYDGQKLYRVVKGFVVQWGIHGDPRVSAAWAGARIPDDPVKEKNATGTITFARSGPNSRTTQVFVNLGDNRKSLDKLGFAPFGVVVEGMDVVKKLYAGYGDMASQGGRGVDAGKLQVEGNPYAERDFPKLDAIVKATVE